MSRDPNPLPAWPHRGAAGQMRAVPYRAPGEGRAYPEPYVFAFPALDNVRRLLTLWKAR